MVWSWLHLLEGCGEDPDKGGVAQSNHYDKGEARILNPLYYICINTHLQLGTAACPIYKIPSIVLPGVFEDPALTCVVQVSFLSRPRFWILSHAT